MAGGVESISMVQNDLNLHFFAEEWLLRHEPDLYTPMLYTADFVAKKYGISRERQDEYALQSQQRTAAAQDAGRFDAEIVPMPSWKNVQERETGAVREERVELGKDEGNRPDTTLAGLASLKAAVVVMSSETAKARGLQPLGIYRGYAVAGCDPGEMGIGPVYAVPKLLDRQGLTIGDVGLWELNEAFAVQTVYCRDRLGLPNDRFNVDGGAISIGHPYGMSGARTDRRQTPRREVCRHNDVHRRRHGRRGTIRSALDACLRSCSSRLPIPTSAGCLVRIAAKMD